MKPYPYGVCNVTHRGQGLLSAGTQRVAFQSIASPTEHYLVTSSPAELAAYADTTDADDSTG